MNSYFYKHFGVVEGQRKCWIYASLPSLEKHSEWNDWEKMYLFLLDFSLRA